MTSDADLLALSAGGSDAAFADLFDRHYTPVFRYARRILGNETDAADAAQTTFITAWGKIRSVRLVGDSALPWLLSTCRFVVLNQLRAQKRRGEVELTDAVATVTGTPEDPKVAWAIDEIGHLGEIDRRACELTLVSGLSYREAAERLGTTAGAVAKRVERSRSRLKALWAEYETS
jgi:RNA polymerase sigma factor (sigma-70 family)